MTATDQSRISALEAKFAEKEREKAELETHLIPQPPKPSQLASEMQAGQNRALEARRAARAEWEASWAAQVERNAPALAQLERQQAELAERQRTLETNHLAEMNRIAAERRALGEKWSRLASPPPMPVVVPPSVELTGGAFGLSPGEIAAAHQARRDAFARSRRR